MVSTATGGLYLPVVHAADAIEALNAGETFCYFVGSLSRDRINNSQIEQLARLMLEHGMDRDFCVAGEWNTIEGRGTGALTQRKIGPLLYEYRFTKS